jgi:hypothetical protein
VLLDFLLEFLLRSLPRFVHPGCTIEALPFPSRDLRIAVTIDNPMFFKGKGDKDVDAVKKPREGR